MQNPGMHTPSSSNATTEAIRERAAAGIDRAASTAHQTVDKLTTAANSTKERLAATGELWMTQSQRAMEYTRDCVRTHPLAALGIAVAAGVLISRITSRR